MDIYQVESTSLIGGRGQKRGQKLKKDENAEDLTGILYTKNLNLIL